MPYLEQPNLIVYADLLYIQNLLFDLTVLKCSFYATQIRRAMFAPGWCGVLWFLLQGFFTLIKLGIPLLIRTDSRIQEQICLLFLFVMRLLSGTAKMRREVRLQLLFYGTVTAVFLGGVIVYIQQFYRGIKGVYFAIGVSILILSILFVLQMRQKMVGSHLHQVCIRQGDQEVKVWAFYDSGNLLMDPYCKQPVHIISKQIKEQLNIQSSGRLIPFSTISGGHELLMAYDVEDCYLLEETKKTPHRKLSRVVGVANQNIFEGKEYQMLLHASVE